MEHGSDLFFGRELFASREKYAFRAISRVLFNFTHNFKKIQNSSPATEDLLLQ